MAVAPLHRSADISLVVDNQCKRPYNNSMKPFDPLWLRLVRAVSLIVVLVWVYAWVMNDDYQKLYSPMAPIRTSIGTIIGGEQR
jgi:hypothetical protein